MAHHADRLEPQNSCITVVSNGMDAPTLNGIAMCQSGGVSNGRARVGIDERDPVRHHRGLVASLDLHDAMADERHAARLRLHALQGLAQPHPGAAGYEAGEAQLVESVVHTVGHSGDAKEHATRQVREERQREEAVGNRTTPFPLCPLPVDVDPLVVLCEPREIIDVPLLDGHPIAQADFLPNMAGQVVHGNDRNLSRDLAGGAHSLMPAAFTIGVQRLISLRT